MTLLESLLYPPHNIDRQRFSFFLRGKTVLITGASFGIGEALTQLCSVKDVNLILIARSADKLSSLARQAQDKGAKVRFFSVDLRDENARTDCIETIKKEYDVIDILIHNAGKSIRRYFVDSLDRYRDVTRCMAVNYFAPVDLCLKLYPLIRKNTGHILHVSALNVLLPPFPAWSAYQSSKVAFDQWFRCIAPELDAEGIACSTLYLPLVRTRMIEPTKFYAKLPAMSPEQAAQRIARILIKRTKTYRPWWFHFCRIPAVLLSPLYLRLTKIFDDHS